MRITIDIDDGWIHDMQTALRKRSPQKTLEELLTVGNWAVMERKKKRIILSAESNGTCAMRLDMDSLNRIPPDPTS